MREGWGHPAHAEPVDYPFVAGFERFYSSLDGADYLARGGMLLLNELNCVACHLPPEALRDRLEGVEATNLIGVGSRLEPLDLEMMIRNPRFVKRDTVMPSFFAGPDRDLDEVAALKHYLASLREEIPEYPKGNIDSGRRLYHRIGCVGCHAPEVGYRPEELPETSPLELTGLSSVPMNLADRYGEDALTHFLLDPRRHRPSGRMPDFSLTLSEASDLSAYLKAGPGTTLSDDLLAALVAGRDDFSPDSSLVVRGRDLFVAKRCAACHAIPGEPEGPLPGHHARPLADLDPDATGGCFSQRPAGSGVPHYGLDAVQKLAIGEALKRIEEVAAEGTSIAVELDWRLTRLNCYACHERLGKGAPETARELYFPPAVPEAALLGRPGAIPPPLDHAGVKLTQSWWDRILLGYEGRRRARPYLEARMPLFREEDVKPLVSLFRAADAPLRERLPVWPDVAAPPPVGREHPEWISCRQCHPFGGHLPAKLPGIDLSLSIERLDRRYFLGAVSNPHEWLPAVPAPILDKKRGRDSALELWRWLGK